MWASGRVLALTESSSWFDLAERQLGMICRTGNGSKANVVVRLGRIKVKLGLIGTLITECFVSSGERNLFEAVCSCVRTFLLQLGSDEPGCIFRISGLPCKVFKSGPLGLGLPARDGRYAGQFQ